MFQKLVSHNDDIRRLVESGYAVAFDSEYLVVRDIPYLDAEQALCWGAFVAKLEFTDNDHVRQTDHQVFFAGREPYGADGRLIPNLGGGPIQLPLSEACADVVVQRSFSNKPRTTGAFADFYEKIASYTAIISGPAILKYPDATPLTFRAAKDVVSDSVFNFHDTLTSRAEITDLAARFKNDVVAIIGLGGTGSYLLDFMVKTPVKEIRGFDHDSFFVHNTFRSPGRVENAELRRPKAEVYASRYTAFRKGLSLVPKFIDASCESDVEGVTFAFVCVDKGPSRAGIFDLLISKGIPFIDVGMGLRKKDTLNGMLRMTYVSPGDPHKVREQGLVELKESTEDIYRANIQIGELNALNASLALIRFKQLRGFYNEGEAYYHHILRVNDLSTIGRTDTDAD